VASGEAINALEDEWNLNESAKESPRPNIHPGARHINQQTPTIEREASSVPLGHNMTIDVAAGKIEEPGLDAS